MTKEIGYPLQDLDEYCFSLQCAANTINAVHTAMECGAYTAESFLDAVFCCYTVVYDISVGMRDAVDRAFAAAREEQGNG